MSIPVLPDWAAVGSALHRWVVAGSRLPREKVVYGRQDAPRPATPAITMWISNIAASRQWLQEEDNPLVFAPKTVVGVEPETDTLLVPGHGLQTGDGPVQLSSTDTVPTGVVAGRDYWVIVQDVDRLQIATTFASALGDPEAGKAVSAVDLRDEGSGSITLACTSATRRAGEELVAIRRGYQRVSLQLRCHSADGTGANSATAILERVRSRSRLPSQIAILDTQEIGLLGVDHVSALLGTRDAALFEPRASVIAHFNIRTQELEFETIIEAVEITDLISSRIHVVG